MRPIEFRGKRTDNGQWVYGDLVHTSDGTLCISDPKVCIPRAVQPETVGEASDYILPDGRRVFEGDKFSVKNDRGETVTAVCERGMARRMIMGNEVDISCFYFRVDAYEGKKTFPIVKNYAGVHDLSMFQYLGTVHDEEDKMEEFLECEYCGKKDESVEHTVDPFEQEINNNILWKNLCKDCYTQRSEDV